MSLFLSTFLSSPLFFLTKLDVKKSLLTGETFSYCYEVNYILFNVYCFRFWTTGCPVFTDFFQEPLIGTSIPQLVMTNDSFSSQTWAIYVPNRNSDVKSILWPPGPLRVRSQNRVHWQYSTILAQTYSFNSDCLASRCDLNLIKDSFGNLLNTGVEWKQSSSNMLKDLTKILWRFQFSI